MYPLFPSGPGSIDVDHLIDEFVSFKEAFRGISCHCANPQKVIERDRSKLQEELLAVTETASQISKPLWVISAVRLTSRHCRTAHARAHVSELSGMSDPTIRFPYKVVVSRGLVSIESQLKAMASSTSRDRLTHVSTIVVRGLTTTYFDESDWQLPAKLSARTLRNNDFPTVTSLLSYNQLFISIPIRLIENALRRLDHSSKRTVSGSVSVMLLGS